MTGGHCVTHAVVTIIRQIGRVLETFPFRESKEATEVRSAQSGDFVGTDVLDCVSVVHIQVKAVGEEAREAGCGWPKIVRYVIDLDET
jgi:hypothetical protein